MEQRIQYILKITLIEKDEYIEDHHLHVKRQQQQQQDT